MWQKSLSVHDRFNSTKLSQIGGTPVPENRTVPAGRPPGSRERYLAAATVYRAIFEEVDAKYHWVDGACDHYAQVIQRALDGYTNCVLATEPTPAEFDTYAGVIEARTTTDPPINTDQFQRALREFEDQSETERE